MILREVGKSDKIEILKMYEEYLNSKQIPGIDTFEGIRHLEKLDNMDFEEWLIYLEKNKYEQNLPKNYSPETFYVAVDEEEKIVGATDLRWKLVPVLEKFGGLIGYSVRPSKRGKGYANEILQLGLKEFNKREFEKVLITCKDFNIPSKKVIERNGGVYENSYYNEETGYTHLRYWINLK